MYGNINPVCIKNLLICTAQEPFPKCCITIACLPESVYNYVVLITRQHKPLKGEKEMRGLTTFVLMPLTIIGALNWGLIGIFGFDLVAFIFGPATIASSIVYSIIGIAALVWVIWMFIDRPVRNER